MSVHTFLATTGHGLVRAERRVSVEWSVEVLAYSLESDKRGGNTYAS